MIKKVYNSNKFASSFFKIHWSMAQKIISYYKTLHKLTLEKSFNLFRILFNGRKIENALLVASNHIGCWYDMNTWKIFVFLRVWVEKIPKNEFYHGHLIKIWYNLAYLIITTRVEVPEINSAEQRCFIVLTFFSADSEEMKNISADQLCFSADQLWFSLNQRCSELKNSALFQSWTALFQRETALHQRCSALIFLALKHWIFSAEQRWFTLSYLWH